ncbi:MAG TPA: glycosyltransferase family 2 protein [bacterium]|nr:glycosyltransferase family 2 protein [bacterium]
MLLSIIIPTYNNQKNLSRCLLSLKEQTVFELYKKEVEVIIINDGGESFEMHGVLPLSHPRDRHNDILYKIFTIKHSGASAARNFGFTKLTGQYVFFCDSDVIFLKNNALEKMIKILEQNLNKAYCYSSFKFGWKIFKLFSFDQEKLKQNNYISTMSIIRRSALEKLSFPNIPFDESLKKFQDWDLWLALLKLGETGIFLDEILWQAKSGGTMSKWIPKIFYKIFKNSHKVQAYQKAKEIIIKKYNL